MGKLSIVWRKLPKPVQRIAEGFGIKKIGLNIYKKSAAKKLVQLYLESDDVDKRSVAEYVKQHGLNIFPYPFTEKYNWQDIVVFRDEDGDPYVLHKGKRLYGIKQDDDLVKKWYADRIMEQDDKSPHCYCQKKEHNPQENCILAEIGAAEGMFSLEWIENCKKVYLFECLDEWIEPLKKTFAPWEDKVEIVPKYVGSGIDESISLDEFFKDKHVSVLKADIEGAELSMMKGGEKIFRNKLKQVYITTYHHYDHPGLIQNMLIDYGFETDFNDGYMLMCNLPSEFDKNMLRRAVIYGEKRENITS